MTAWFTASTSPESGAVTSETAFTDSTSPYEASFATVEPSVGGSKCTSSPSASWANQVIPSTASSPSTRAQSWSLWYFRSSGYDSAAAKSALPLVDRFLDDPRLSRLAPHVDRQLGAGGRLSGGHVAHPDPDVEHRRVPARGHLAAPPHRHALSR